MEKNLREMQNEFNWFKTNQKRLSDFDVTINFCRNNNGKDRFSLTFRNGCFKHFGSDRIEIAVFKNRVMFRGSSAGWKLSGDSKAILKENRYCQFHVCNDNEILKDFTGDYELKYDKFYELYYIEKETV